MNEAENPYSVPESQPRFDAMMVYQESFFALIWPSLVISFCMLGWMLLVETFVPESTGNASPFSDSRFWVFLVTGVMSPVTSYFLTARRLMRSDGQRRSVRRSVLIAVGLTIYGIGAAVGAIAVAGVARALVPEINQIDRTAINTMLISPVHSLLLCVIFKLCWRELRLRRFASISLGTTTLIILGGLSHPDMPELTKRIFLTFICTLISLTAHCTCFSWWYALRR